ncbi:MAG TPA: FAD-dependent oxidoreductase [Pseudolabrys sp.]|uniref:FAD-dependent oxidoreductase n=1 Tax=Pseudolabrys sp. TaxID=1960880 RepID=UPI002DDCC696|nr:FAD-dependent oxidoreductase [Pseudolabrys sp.]HEV2630348.1 FAD-dependent oxidoreductase [Pseudolabrys sp.]
MPEPAPLRIVVVGQGAAGVAAALSAAEAARTAGRAVAVTLIDKASESDAGGNTRWSPSNMRMASPDRVEDSFVHDVLAATKNRGDARYFTRLAADAPEVAAWAVSHGVAFIQPPYYLAKGPPRIQPQGGGAALLAALVKAAKAAGVSFRYECAARGIVQAEGRIVGLEVDQSGRRETLPAEAIVLANGGFQGSAALMREHFGPGGDTMRLISPGTHYNGGDGIAMALAAGAAKSGDWNGMHAEPVDARATTSAPVVLVYPFGIVVDKTGRRFFDEGAGLVHETWEWLAREIHFNRPGSIAYTILDSRLFDIADYKRAIRSEVEPFRADTLSGLAGLIGVDAAALGETIAAYNAACVGTPDAFDATRCDGLHTHGLAPPKSNWARAIASPPYLAWPLVGAVAYTFGGIATDEHARVLRPDGTVLPGLYAAGEITGHFYEAAPNSVAVLRALVFGRIAGRQAVAI